MVKVIRIRYSEWVLVWCNIRCVNIECWFIGIIDFIKLILIIMLESDNIFDNIIIVIIDIDDFNNFCLVIFLVE